MIALSEVQHDDRSNKSLICSGDDESEKEEGAAKAKGTSGMDKEMQVLRRSINKAHKIDKQNS